MTRAVGAPSGAGDGAASPKGRGKAAAGLRVERVWTTEGVHPYDEVTWERRDVVMTNWRDGSVNFEQRGVEFPESWSINAANIVTTKYFRGALGTKERESSLRQLIDRVVRTYRRAGEEHGYFASEADAEIFDHELTWMLLHQVFSFNSPVWFNVGTPSRQQVSACQPYDAMVSTPSGLIPIGRLVEENAVGTKVFDANGLTKIVAVRANGTKEVLRIRTKAGYALDVTPDHLVWRAQDIVAGAFVEAGTVVPGDSLLWVDPDAGGTNRSLVEITSVEARGLMEVYDVQTESGEYLSGNLRVHNCFILAVDDSMDSILDWYKEEGLIFQGGSGSGVNLSRIRASKELLSSGGTASGPVSFMRGADASAGTIKSGGATRRAAKMVILDVDHPDVEEFIVTKAREEDKIRALRDAGFDMDLGGHDIVSVQYQNANNSVRVSDEFMHAIEEGRKFDLLGRLDGRVIDTVDARDLFRKMAQAAWECADPGIQYDSTINDWHTNPETGRITASNPCCFVGETLVSTVEGPIAIEQIVKLTEAGETPIVHAYDAATGAFVERPVVKGWLAGRTRELVEVTTSTGVQVSCTPEHRFLTDMGWVEARHLAAGSRLVAPTGTDEVIRVRRRVENDDVAVYDIEVEGVHSFVVTTGDRPGVVAHNSEYMSLDNSSCNLASLNLMKFRREDGSFDVDNFVKSVELIITAMDISICFADFPTQKIAETTRAYRQLGVGYANLGALLMASGLPYDSDAGRSVAAAITSLMTGTAYRRSAELAGVVGPYDGYARNADPHKRVMRKHAAASDEIKPYALATAIAREATKQWQQCLKLGEKNGYRNGQASLLAPTGTIGLAMDCDTTGIEPDLALVKYKKLVGGGSMQIVNQTVPAALRTLGYPEEQVEAIVEYISEHGDVVNAPGLKPDHYAVFDCAMGERAIAPMGHVRMMAATQPLLSGAISKTVNVPESATVDDIEKIYFEGWKLGLKALAIYRDNCKVGQPLSNARSKKEVAEAVPEKVVEYRPVRKRLPKKRPSETVSFSVSGAKGYLTASSYPDDGLGEVFLKMSKQGSTLAGVMDAFSIAISIGLQYGVPLETFVGKFTNMRFEPAGMTDDPDIRMAASVMDYIFRRLALDFLPFERRAELGIFTAAERAAQARAEAAGEDIDLAALAASAPIETKPPKAAEPEKDKAKDQDKAKASVKDEGTAAAKPISGVGSSTELLEQVQNKVADAPLCFTCGTKMRPAGSCYVCEGCGSTSGCS